ncbi:MAG TPA: molybdopterin-binding protein [Anaeromyxobacteraceae bacterium]|jgi:molybdenum cofactor synthesis domain-containing protein
MRTPSAALLVVGNEVLSAKVRDENGPFAASSLRGLGVRLAAVLVLPDEVEVIAEAVARERARVDWLFTSGGVGPTHDDVTLAAVARALERPVVRHQALADFIRRAHWRWWGTEAPEAALRMADAPQGTRLEGDPEHPILAVENVVMLPGVPSFFRVQFERFARGIAAAPFHLAEIFVSAGEDVLAPVLDRLAAAHAAVDIGSYPRFDGADHRVKVTIESKDRAGVEAARDALLAALPPGSLVRVEGP